MLVAVVSVGNWCDVRAIVNGKLAVLGGAYRNFAKECRCQRRSSFLEVTKARGLLHHRTAEDVSYLRQSRKIIYLGGSNPSPSPASRVECSIRGILNPTPCQASLMTILFLCVNVFVLEYGAQLAWKTRILPFNLEEGAEVFICLVV